MPMSDKLKNLIVRTLSGIGLLALLLGATLFSYGSFVVLVLLILIGGMWEFYGLARATGAQPQRFWGILAALLLFLIGVNVGAVAMVTREVYEIPAIPVFVVALFLLLLFPALSLAFALGKGDSLKNVGATLLGVAYVALPLALLVCLPAFMSPNGSWNPWLVLAYIFLIWGNDVFAYLAGIAFGRHKMCPSISPKKSWEGFVGGILGAVAVGYVASLLLDASPLLWCCMALLAAVTGVLGDLVESQLKRKAGVKDSGNLIPGHGGVLDRFDALLLATPFVFLFWVAYNLFVL